MRAIARAKNMEMVAPATIAVASQRPSKRSSESNLDAQTSGLERATGDLSGLRVRTRRHLVVGGFLKRSSTGSEKFRKSFSQSKKIKGPLGGGFVVARASSIAGTHPLALTLAG